MRILCVGDVVGGAGCAHLRKTLPGIKRLYGVDICIVNGENAADGNGLTPSAAVHIFDSGADVITGGNHTFRRRELYDVLDKNPALLRPANYPASAPGRGLYMVDRGRYQVAVISLLGVVYLEPLACPFGTLDLLLKEAGNPRFCIVDFHAEATAEKKSACLLRRRAHFRPGRHPYPCADGGRADPAGRDRIPDRRRDDRPGPVGAGGKAGAVDCQDARQAPGPLQHGGRPLPIERRPSHAGRRHRENHRDRTPEHFISIKQWPVCLGKTRDRMSRKPQRPSFMSKKAKSILFL